MPRFSILTGLLTVPRHVELARADTPADAVRIAREYAKQGKTGLKIGDNDLAQYFPVEEFAAKYGVR